MAASNGQGRKEAIVRNRIVRVGSSYDLPRWDGRLRADRHRKCCCGTCLDGTERHCCPAGTNVSSWGATPSDPGDPLDPSGCMLPFPNDSYTVPSPTMPTGRQILPFVGLLDTAYPSKAIQQVGFDLIQTLWDRGEADGLRRANDRRASRNTLAQVLLEEAFGDHQVANVATETEARTIGAAILEPTLTDPMSASRVGTSPRLTAGSKRPGLTVWDSGLPAAPLTETPPVAGPDEHLLFCAEEPDRQRAQPVLVGSLVFTEQAIYDTVSPRSVPEIGSSQ